ncbi:unnamed protein product, partial [Timema podura]|nr:unnamed protein product [Timema podura]
TPETVLLLEDLTTAGFKMVTPKHQGLNLAHCRLVLRQLASLHASSAMLFVTDPTSMELYKEPLVLETEVDRQHWGGVFPGLARQLAAEVLTWPEFGERSKEKLHRSEVRERSKEKLHRSEVRVRSSSTGQGEKQGVASQVRGQGEEQVVASQVRSQGEEQGEAAQVRGQGEEQGVASQVRGQGEKQGVVSQVRGQGEEQGVASQVRVRVKKVSIRGHCDYYGWAGPLI